MKLISGEGKRDSGLYLIGEAGGRIEELYNRPFVGLSGKCLQIALEHVNLSRRDVYIDNVCKIFPRDYTGAMRSPTEEELEKYGKELIKDLNKYQPKAIITLGGIASNFLSDTYNPMYKYAGTTFTSPFLKYSHVVIPTYHPSAIIRNDFWEEFDTLLGALAFAKFSLRQYPDELEGRESIYEIPKEDELDNAFDRLHQAWLLVFDVEVDGECIGIGIGDSPYFSYYFPLAVKGLFGDRLSPYYRKQEYLFTKLRNLLLSKIPKGGQNIKYDMGIIEETLGIIPARVEYDTLEMARLFYNEQKKRSLDMLSARFRPIKGAWKKDIKKMFRRSKKERIGLSDLPLETIARYCGQDVMNTFWLALLFRYYF